MKDKKYNFETLQIHAGQETPDSATDARAVPIYATSSYVFKDFDTAADRFALKSGGNIYSRLQNPTTDVFEKRIAALEGGIAAIATASGQAATMYALQNIAVAGDHIVSSKYIYGGTYTLLNNTLRDQGIDVTFVDANDLGALSKAIKENTKAVFAESVTNPNADVSDIEGIAAVAHKFDIPLIVDNTLATPFLVRPIDYGADIVVHSATKFIGGHGTVLGGVIIDSGKFDFAKSGKFKGLSAPNPSYHGLVFTDACGDMAYINKIRTTIMRDIGAVLSPFHSFLFLQGLETLSLRLERHVYNTLKTVEFLSSHKSVENVNHPSLKNHKDNAHYMKYLPKGGASIFTFDIAGGEAAAKSFIGRLKLFSHLANVADVKSLVIHPGSTTHSQMTAKELSSAGIRPSTIRLSIGTEHIDDILADLDGALKNNS